MTILLNGLERRKFELVYQTAKNYPSLKIENIFLEKSYERDQIQKCGELFYTRHRKPNRLTIACHESGHSIVMSATHGSVGSAQIDLINHPNGFLGLTVPGREFKESDCQLTEQELSNFCAPGIIREILIVAGGFVGESFCGKQSASSDEKFLTYCRCRFLDEVAKVPPLTNWNYFVNWTKQIILNNRTLFWRLTDDLLMNRQLTESLKTILHHEIRKETVDKFF